MLNNQQKAERAKLFVPYDALKGYRSLLQAKEKIIVPRITLMQDTCEILDRKLRQLSIGSIIQIVYYDGEHYISLEGMVSKIDLVYKKQIQIVRQKVSIKDIVEIKDSETDEE